MSILHPLPNEGWDPSLDPIRAALGEPLNIHRVLARHPALLRAWWPLRTHLVSASSLSPRLRELVILTTAHELGVEYEWVHHVERGLQAGLTRDEIDAVREATSPTWSDAEHAAVTAARELCRNHRLPEATAAQLDRMLGAEGLLDIVVTVGGYFTLALVLRSFDIQLEEPR